MARKPNYGFERMERDKADAEKAARKAAAKLAKKEAKARGEDVDHPDWQPPEDEAV
ncbi:hypothetical protein [Brevundimonas sp.]|jgi:hypothetical protein|uniref:hypothetical protein n=1 Tax=Brevundimonas sp. TaxID=1871086 RepID=UPI0026A57199|nr:MULTISPECIES: hypothetical protein [Brevundimonas]